jgi:hypothetical protein
MNPVIGLNVGRMVVGVVSITKPDLLARMLGLDVSNAQWPYVSRMFGGREIALGAATLLAAGSARRNLVAAGMLVDGIDAASGLLAVREKSVHPALAGGLALTGLAAVISGARGLTDH